MGIKSRVLIVRFSSFGDVILSLHTVRALRRSGYEGEILFLTKEKFEPLLKALTGKTRDIDRIILLPDNAGLVALIKCALMLRKLEVQYLIDLHNNLRSLFLRVALGQFWTALVLPKYRVREWLCFFFRKYTNVFVRLGILEPNFNRSRKGVSLLGSQDTQSDHHMIPNTTIEAEVKSSPQHKVVMTNDSAWAYKQWNKESFLQCTVLLLAQGVQVTWVGKATGEMLVKSADYRNQILPFSQSSFKDATGEKSFAELTQIISQADLFLGPDTGLNHLAEFLNVPVIGIFGPTHPILGFGPRLKESQAITSQLWCSPCNKTGRFCFRHRTPRVCMATHDSNAVATKVCSQLNLMKPV